MIRRDVKEILEDLKGIRFLVASKYFTSSDILELYSLGIKEFGENRVEQFLPKYEALKEKDIVWHFIGHLQRNKAKDVIDKIDYLDSLDSLELAKLIQKYRVTPLKCLVEVKMVNNQNKSGIQINEVEAFINELKKYDKISVAGLMTMVDPDLSDEEKYQIFKEVNDLRIKLNLKETSAGMTSDYQIALKAGSTIVRLGSLFCEEA